MFEVEDERPTLTIATFSHGKLKKKKHKKIKFLSYQQNQDENKKRKRILVGKTDSICYVANNFNDEKSDYSEMYKHYVGVLNKTTGKMQICDVEIFNLAPKFPDMESMNEDISESKNLSHVQQNLKLINTFGTVASRRMIDNNKKTIVEGSMLDDAIDSVLDQTVTAEDQTVVEDEAVESSILPHCNVNATSPEDVYNISDIISPAEMGCLHEYVKDILDFKPEDLDNLKKNDIYCSCVLNRLPSLPPLGSPERETKAHYLQYLQYMVTLKNMELYTIKSKDFFSYFPPVVCKQFFAKFLHNVRDAGGVLERYITSSLRDKLLLHILVLLLIIDDFSISFDNIQKELNTQAKRLHMLFNYIGCQIQRKRGSVNKIAVLKIPVKIIKPRKGSKSLRVIL